jgi:hypothetical protein
MPLLYLVRIIIVFSIRMASQQLVRTAGTILAAREGEPSAPLKKVKVKFGMANAVNPAIADLEVRADRSTKHTALIRG